MMTNDTSHEAVERLDEILETGYDTQRSVEQDPFGATRAIEQALIMIRALSAERLRTDRDLWKAKAEVQGYNRIKAEMEAQPEPVAVVKPLEWEGDDTKASTINLRGQVSIEYDRDYGWIIECITYGDNYDDSWVEYPPNEDGFETIAAAKAFVENLHQEDLASWVASFPARSEADVWEEAAKIVLNCYDDHPDGFFRTCGIRREAVNHASAALRERGSSQ